MSWPGWQIAGPGTGRERQDTHLTGYRAMRCPTLAELPPPPPGKTGWPWTEESPRLPGTMPDGSTWPCVSIVTPSYNQVGFIEETLRSVLLQGYPNLDYGIVDGGSADGSVEIIRKYQPWLAHWVSQPDRGQSHAINKGWSRSHGRILAWLNSDDTYQPGAVSIAVGHLLSHPSAGMVYADGNLMNPQSQITGYVQSGPLNLAQLLSRERPIPQPTAFIWRHAVECAGFLDLQLHYTMDYDLWIRIARYFELYYIPTTLANIRIWNETKMVSQSDKWLAETLRILGHAFGQVDLRDDTHFIQALAYGRLYWSGGLAAYARGNTGLGQEYCRLALEQPCWVEADVHRLLNPLLYREKSIGEGDRQRFIRQVLEDLPQSARKAHHLDRLVWREYYTSRVAIAHRRKDRAGVVRSFWMLLLHEPSAIINRGVMSVLLENLVGGTCVRKARNTARAMRARLHARRARGRVCV